MIDGTTPTDSTLSLPLRIAVCGASVAQAALLETAEEVGRAIARRNAVLVCGGMGGVMEAAARGARHEGGTTIGVLPGANESDANPWISLPLPTAMGEGRNILVVRFANALIALGGEWGTLSEIALAMRIGTPVILLQPTLARNLSIETATGPDDAVSRAIDRALGIRDSR
jgi:hypothetical protein